MLKLLHSFTLAVCLAAITGCATTKDDHLEVDSPRAQLFENMGTHKRSITTSSPEAQEFFNQGLAWMYSFNHDEAIRSFSRAAFLDPECAMAWWGISLCEGPNYNDSVMTDERSAAAWSSLQGALRNIEKARPVERALINALAERYTKPWPESRTELEQDYADAMAKLWETYPKDTDIGTLYAEAMMDQRPWKLYSIDSKPEGDTLKIVATLNRVLELAPNHPGANHLLIHAVEPSDDPGQALAAAYRLEDLVPGAGHMNHMPSHIYVQTGHWEKSLTQNRKALEADARYRAQAPDQGVQHMYMVHNAHMLAYTAMMVGRETEAMSAARSMWNNVPAQVLEGVAPYIDLWMTSVYDVQKRFGRWDAILAEPTPPAFLPMTTAIWRAHRAIAYAALKDFAGAEREYKAFHKAKASIPKDSVFGDDPSHRILAVSDRFIAGEIALQQGDWTRASELLESGAEVEDALSYGEPPQWLQPIRHTLGAVYLKSHRYEDAERVYRQDLAKWPGNGWSLYGLSRALDGQGRSEEAAAIKREHLAAWAQADAPIATSCLCLPGL